MRTKTLNAVASAFALAFLATAQAQMPVVAEPAEDAPNLHPEGLPGDSPMPSLGFQLHRPTSPIPGQPVKPKLVNATPGPPIELAMEAAQAALDACTAMGGRIGVAVIDSAGQLKAALSADGAAPGRIYTAVRKGLTAIEFKMPNIVMRTQMLADPALASRLKPTMSVFAGAVPIMVGDRVLGAIAASGATGDQEEKCAAIGLAKIQSRLK